VSDAVHDAPNFADDVHFSMVNYSELMTTDDRERMRAFYDELGESEWSRLESTPRGRVSYQVHRAFLERYVRPGDRVLEVGAGPGRFTVDLAPLGASIDVTDFSPVQLELHRQHVALTPAEAAVRSRELLDVCDTSRYAE
jgi:2-polyprenyl-3-methyl-5-hydroxy-6-metoxy-1,4-benzoquinol methylase